MDVRGKIHNSPVFAGLFNRYLAVRCPFSLRHVVCRAKLVLDRETDPEDRWQRIRQINREVSQLRRDDHRAQRNALNREKIGTAAPSAPLCSVRPLVVKRPVADPGAPGGSPRAPHSLRTPHSALGSLRTPHSALGSLRTPH